MGCGFQKHPELQEEMLTNKPWGFPVTIDSQAANKEEHRLAICDMGKIK